jgi:diamine N-acetyltransferase
MFLCNSSAKFTHKLTIIPLINKPQALEQAAIWAESEWGYLRVSEENPQGIGVEGRKEKINNMLNDFYMIYHSNTPVGMFALSDVTILDENKKKLSYFYIIESMRGLGIGGQILEDAKNIAKANGSDMIVLDTLKPRLNHFYENHGAKVVSDFENLEFNAPMSALRINCK